MTRIGVSGHQRIPAAVVSQIVPQVRQLIAKQPTPLIGYSSLAAGADQLVAQLVIDAGGDLHAVIPAAGYDTTFDDDTLPTYRALLAAATTVTELPFTEPSEKAYDAAGHYVVDHSDILLALWDGEPSRGLGGTADAVAYARSIGRAVHVVWPDGVTRD